MLKHWLALLLMASTVQAQTGRPALIPLPQSVAWTDQQFVLTACKAIIAKDTRLQKEARRLQKYLGVKVPIVTRPFGEPFIELRLESGLNSEAYRLKVGSKRIMVVGNTAHGVYNALQTLRQLIVDGQRVAGCTIADEPAYAWRGYMVDVGRNFQSVALLKQQIDQMARYKLNVFHFHLTEDIAWRLQIKRYPQLTDAANMTRNKGSFYSVAAMQELIHYCRDRYITLVPEIDMPGHSAAFKRAMKTDMQSREGLQMVKHILKELCTTYELPYFHIGADEVTIRNKLFLPEVTALLRSYGKQVIGWAPGGNYDSSVIRQLWKDVRDTNSRYIDSRSSYISDMDPANCVVSLFQRRFGTNRNMLGAEFCLWSDRKVAVEDDLLRTNPVYPAMLAFAERTWRGGGYDSISFAIVDTAAFKEFEQRLLAHKQFPFQYVQQTDIRWSLYGPFDNKGDGSASFWPEGSVVDSLPVFKAVGGTVWLWHTNGPAVKAWLPSFVPQSTWYAASEFYSAYDTVAQFWMDGKDHSRSGADATAKLGEWDYQGTRFWLNDSLIAPPAWRFAGRRSGLLEEPLADEAHYYRPPVWLRVQKGWNRVLVKLPIDRFDRSDWQVPPKWMFTFVPVRKDDKGFYVFDERLLFR